MKIAMVGTGYVGLVSAACFAELGFDVTCLDKDEGKLQDLANGILPFYEPGLSEYVTRNLKEGRLHFAGRLENAIGSSEIIMIAVGTPCDPDTGHTNLTELYSALDLIAPFLDENKLVVLKSTVPVGTSRKVQDYLNVEVASNPEFLREGSAIDDFMRPARIILGTESLSVRSILRRLYRYFVAAGVPVIETTPTTAELIKYASNAFLATKISFINQIADFCENCGGDVRQVSRALGLDSRIGAEFLSPGPGFGGSCFTKDLKELRLCAEKCEAPLSIVEQVLDYNQSRPGQMVKIIQTAFGYDLKDKTLAILGLTFKANTDDLRDSPSLKLISRLCGLGLRIRVYDPKGMELAKILLPEIEFKKSSYDAIEGADGLAILTEWLEFTNLDLERVKKLLNEPIIIDLRNIFSLEEMKERGFTYYSLGHRPLNERSYVQ